MPTVGIARVGEEPPRALNLKNLMGLQEIVVADCREMADEPFAQRHGQVAQDGEELGVGALLPEPSRVVGEIGPRVGDRRRVKENCIDVALGKERRRRTRRRAQRHVARFGTCYVKRFSDGLALRFENRRAQRSTARRRAAPAVGQRQRDLVGSPSTVVPVATTPPHAMNHVSHQRTRVFIKVPARTSAPSVAFFVHGRSVHRWRQTRFYRLIYRHRKRLMLG